MDFDEKLANLVLEMKGDKQKCTSHTLRLLLHKKNGLEARLAGAQHDIETALEREYNQFNNRMVVIRKKHKDYCVDSSHDSCHVSYDRVTAYMIKKARIEQVLERVDQRIRDVNQVTRPTRQANDKKEKNTNQPTDLITHLFHVLDTIVLSETQPTCQLFYLEILHAWWSDPIKTLTQYMNIILNGDPGTGKTRTAHNISKLCDGLSIVIDPHTVEYTASAFIGEFAGQTGPKTLEVLNDSLDKVLFLDEAYALVQVGDKGASYGDEALSEIVNFLSTHIGEIVFIMAGYEADMKTLLRRNVGLSRRFPHKISLTTPSNNVACREMMRLLAEHGIPIHESFTIDFMMFYSALQVLYRSVKPVEKSMTLFGNGMASIIQVGERLSGFAAWAVPEMQSWTFNSFIKTLQILYTPTEIQWEMQIIHNR